MRRLLVCGFASLVTLAVAHAPARSTGWPGDPAVNVPLCTSSGTQHFPSITRDNVGGAFVVWADARRGNLDIYVQHVTASGSIAAGWPVDGLPICTAPGIQEAPVIAADGSGGAVVVWEDRRSGLGLEADLFGVRIDAAGSLVSGWTADGSPLCTIEGQQGDLDILGLADGGAIVTWWDQRDDDGDIYALRFTGAGGAASGWTSGGAALCTAAGTQGEPHIVTDGSGGAIVVWVDERAGETDLYAMRVRGNGALAGFWVIDGSPVCTAAGAQLNPVLVSDDDGGAIVAWEDLRDVETDIYARRVTRTGSYSSGWDPDGNPVCTAYWYQSHPTVAPDGAGGAIVAWQDTRGADGDIYAHRISVSGAIPAGWQADGEPLVTGLGDQVVPEIVSDGMGGAIVGWRDDRMLGAFDLYAQRVTTDGDLAAGWSVDGMPVSTATGAQLSLAMTSDDAQGAILCWQDTRNSSDDVYAQRVQADGSLGRVLAVPAAPEHGSLRLAAPSPSPASHGVVFRFSLHRASPVSLAVFDAVGRRVRDLSLGHRESGDHAISWDLFSRDGAPVADGVYWVRLVAEGKRVSRSFVVAR